MGSHWIPRAAKKSLWQQCKGVQEILEGAHLAAEDRHWVTATKKHTTEVLYKNYNVSHILYIDVSHEHSSHEHSQYLTWWLIPLSKWVITPVINGISRVNPLITGVITHLRAVGWATKYSSKPTFRNVGFMYIKSLGRTTQLERMSCIR